MESTLSQEERLGSYHLDFDGSLGTTALPRWRSNWLLHHVDRTSTGRLILQFLGLYGATVLLYTFPLWCLANTGVNTVQHGAHPITSFGRLLYFNLITILTVGYGDLAPVGFCGRTIAVLEAMTGVALMGVLLGVVVLKMTQPASNSVVFSRYCYFAKDEAAFIVVFLNTHRAPLVNATISSLVKTNGWWTVAPAVVAPYIGGSVWAFRVKRWGSRRPNRETEVWGTDDIPHSIFRSDDCVRMAITGSYGFAAFAAAQSYSFDQVLVVDKASELRDNPEFSNPKLGSPAFEAAFHYRPGNAQTLLEYLRENGATVHDGQYPRSSDVYPRNDF